MLLICVGVFGFLSISVLLLVVECWGSFVFGVSFVAWLLLCFWFVAFTGQFDFIKTMQSKGERLEKNQDSIEGFFTLTGLLKAEGAFETGATMEEREEARLRAEATQHKSGCCWNIKHDTQNNSKS